MHNTHTVYMYAYVDLSDHPNSTFHYSFHYIPCMGSLGMDVATDPGFGDGSNVIALTKPPYATHLFLFRPFGKWFLIRGSTGLPGSTAQVLRRTWLPRRTRRSKSPLRQAALPSAGPFYRRISSEKHPFPRGHWGITQVRKLEHLWRFQQGNALKTQRASSHVGCLKMFENMSELSSEVFRHPMDVPVPGRGMKSFNINDYCSAFPVWWMSFDFPVYPPTIIPNLPNHQYLWMLLVPQL